MGFALINYLDAYTVSLAFSANYTNSHFIKFNTNPKKISEELRERSKKVSPVQHLGQNLDMYV